MNLSFFVQQEHKWKMFLEIDGDETALLLVKVTDRLILFETCQWETNVFFWSLECNLLDQVDQ